MEKLNNETGAELTKELYIFLSKYGKEKNKNSDKLNTILNYKNIREKLKQLIIKLLDKNYPNPIFLWENDEYNNKFIVELNNILDEYHINIETKETNDHVVIYNGEEFEFKDFINSTPICEKGTKTPLEIIIPIYYKLIGGKNNFDFDEYNSPEIPKEIKGIDAMVLKNINGKVYNELKKNIGNIDILGLNIEEINIIIKLYTEHNEIFEELKDKKLIWSIKNNEILNIIIDLYNESNEKFKDIINIENIHNIISFEKRYNRLIYIYDNEKEFLDKLIKTDNIMFQMLDNNDYLYYINILKEISIDKLNEFENKYYKLNKIAECYNDIISENDINEMIL